MTSLRFALPLDEAAIAAINSLGRDVEVRVEGVPERRWLIADLVAWIAAERGQTVQQILGHGRDLALCHSRFAVAWGAREVLAASWSAIGRGIGRRDHSTALHQVRRAEQLRDCDPAFRELTNRLADRFGGQL